MSLERKDVERIAHLARLTLSEAQIPFYASNLSKILLLIEQMNSAQTQDIIPMAHPLEGLSQRLREDTVTEGNVREACQAIAPQTEAGLYLVPQVIDDH